jgi:hypothetical protein
MDQIRIVLQSSLVEPHSALPGLGYYEGHWEAHVGCHWLYRVHDGPRPSYHVFHTIMASSVAGDKKWEVAWLMMNGAYNWDKYLPWVEDPKDVLVFLEHHFELQANREPH